jgi:peptidoglycan/LPS O-acetylase OafA/YrhL
MSQSLSAAGVAVALPADGAEAANVRGETGTAGHEARALNFSPRRDHLVELDGLRGIAVLLVLWTHLEALTAHTPLRFVDHVLKPGYFGVDIFFVLSGFLITRILLSNKAQDRPIWHFLVRRFLRIFPIYYLTLAVVGLARPGRYLWWYTLYLSNFYLPFTHPTPPMEHTWSLAVEEQFYLLWPWLVYGLPVQKSRAVALWGILPLAVACAVVVLAAKQYLPAWHDLPARKLIYMGSMFRAGSLGLGAVFAFHENWLRENAARVRTVSAALFIVALVIRLTGDLVLQPWGPLANLVGFSALCGAILVAVIGLHGAAVWPARVLRGPVLTFVGRISYGLYLYHFPIYGLFGLLRHQPVNVETAAAAVAVSFVVASLSFYLLEQPILRLKERFA